MRPVAVVDIGKTNAKVALVDLGALAEMEVRSHRNRVLPGPPYPHADVERLWHFICDAGGACREERVEAIVATTHGATRRWWATTGLVLPVLDYEHDGPASWPRSTTRCGRISPRRARRAWPAV